MAKNKSRIRRDRGTGAEPAVVDVSELKAARKDPKVKRFLQDAKAYGNRLTRDGRSS